MKGQPCGRVIVALSGGVSSAWCAEWAIREYGHERVILYFNDTRWEHPDLYRFLADLSAYLNHPIFEDSDQRSPEQVFYDERMIANNRVPFCSRILKVERLQAFYQDGDALVFGIGRHERKRCDRLVRVYQLHAAKSGKFPRLLFPLVTDAPCGLNLRGWLAQTGIKLPALYRYGFEHNNCAGGCARAGKQQWVKLYKAFPDVYADRERVEREVAAYLGKDVHFLKNVSLETLRHQIENRELSTRYDRITGGQVRHYQMTFSECVGMCSYFN